MAGHPEANFYTGVHSKLPKSVYRMKNNNAFVSGVFDVWYSGDKADLWVEYKAKDNSLSAQQILWGKGRLAEGRNLAVIHEWSTNRAVILTGDEMWLPARITRFPPERILTRLQVAQWILASCTL